MYFTLTPPGARTSDRRANAFTLSGIDGNAYLNHSGNNFGYQLVSSTRSVGLYLNTDNTVGLYDNTGTFNRWYTDTAGNLTVANDVSASGTFYDNSNRSYFLKASGNSNLNNIYSYGTLYDGSNAAYYLKPSSTSVFNAGQFDSITMTNRYAGVINFASNVAIYSDTTGLGPGDLVIKTNDGTDHYSVFYKDGRFSVPGIIRSTSGGFQFPDGSIQTYAGGINPGGSYLASNAFSGFSVVASGFVIAWVVGNWDDSFGTENTQTLTLPLTFNTIISAYVSCDIAAATILGDVWYQVVQNQATTSQVVVQRQHSGSASLNVQTRPVVFVIGY
jgi:hypothetical protein